VHAFELDKAYKRVLRIKIETERKEKMKKEQQQSNMEIKRQHKGGRRNACTKMKWRGCWQECLWEWETRAKEHLNVLSNDTK
jgi:hypothetical protein